MNRLNAFRSWVAVRLFAFLAANAVVASAIAVAITAPKRGSIIVAALLLVAVPAALWRSRGPDQATRVAASVATCGFASLYLLCAEGSGVILDTHMTFFAALAISAVWCCWRSLVAAALFIVLHHAMLNAVWPAAVFPEASGALRVLLHGLIVAVEVGALICVSLRLVEAFVEAEEALAEADRSQALAEALAAEQQTIAVRESEAKQHLLQRLLAFSRSVDLLRADLARSASQMETTSDDLTSLANHSAELAGLARPAASGSADGVLQIQMSTQELSAAIREISERMSETAFLAERGSVKACDTRELANRLADSVQNITGFTDMIRAVAQQTNLLALNATIEAARAGEGGRGFAVVAGEVKDLAGQTARAALAIEAQVAEIRTITAQTVEGVSFFAATMSQIDDKAVDAAASVEQQHAATEEISNHIALIAASSKTMADAVTNASAAAESTRASALSARSTAQTVELAAARLHAEVETFVRSAAAP